MADLTDQTEIAAIGADDIFYVVDDPAGMPLPRKAPASKLLTYLKSSGALNIVDDTAFTPGISAGGSGTGLAAASIAIGWYSRLQNRVSFTLTMTISSMGSGYAAGDGVTITGLPIATRNQTNFVQSFPAYFNNLVPGTDIQNAQGAISQPNTTTITPLIMAAASGSFAQIVYSQIKVGTVLRVSGSYVCVP